MGWVTLTLRKTELKRTHADYQTQLLGISRTKRQMARRNHYEQLVVRNKQTKELREIKLNYDEEREYLHESLNSNTLSEAEKNDIRNKLTELQQQYSYDSNEIKTIYEEDLAMIEESANDEETMLDQEQVEIEAQLEAIKAEMDAVGEAISSQIQASTIKLS